MTKTVALTGGTGFIGSTLLNFLLSAGFSVHSLSRNVRSRHASPLLHQIMGDLHDPDSVKQLIQQAEVVIHCAGRVRGRSENEFIADNVNTTRVLLNAVSNQDNIRHLIYISSLAAREPSLSHYSASKKLAEDVIQGHALKSWTIIRPPAVYGPGDRELRPLFDWMRRGILWVPGCTTNRFSLLHSEDLARLVVQLVINPNSNENIIEPDDGRKHAYQWPDIQNIGSKLFCRRVRSVVLRPVILESAARANVVFSKISGTSPMLTPGKVRELLHTDWVSNPDRSAKEWQPEIGFEDGLRKLYSLDR